MLISWAIKSCIAFEGIIVGGSWVSEEFTIEGCWEGFFKSCSVFLSCLGVLVVEGGVGFGGPKFAGGGPIERLMVHDRIEVSSWAALAAAAQKLICPPFLTQYVEYAIDSLNDPCASNVDNMLERSCTQFFVENHSPRLYQSKSWGSFLLVNLFSPELGPC